MKHRLTKNQAQCNKCGDIIESKSRHDFVRCSCGSLAVDGGLDYTRRVFNNIEEWTDLAVWQEESAEEGE